MASPRTVTIVALSFALGLFFVFMGTIKLTPRLSKDAYSEMVSVPLIKCTCCTWTTNHAFQIASSFGSFVLSHRYIAEYEEIVIAFIYMISFIY